ncbi:MAG: BatD family protein [Ferruginibacter sp.]
MNLFLRKILLACWCLLISIYIHAQVDLSLSISPGQINKDEYATLRISVENSNDIQQVIPPSLKKFMVLSGPNQESSMTTINGQVKKYVSLVFVLRPAETGKIHIDPAFVKVLGKTYKTNSTELIVKNALSVRSPATISGRNGFPLIDPFEPPRSSSEYDDYIFRKGENVVDKVNKNMLLRLETDKNTCYVGEPVVATYRLFTRLKSESKLTKNPSFNNFSVVDLTRSDISDYTKQKLNGREYNVYTIRKAQLYPLQPGTIELEPAELENSIQFIKQEYLNNRQNDVLDLFDNFTRATVPPEGIINEKVTLRSEPVTITVKPLPEANKPASFKGAVGVFSIMGTLQKSEFTANESQKLTVTITGKGNLQLLTAPTVNWPAGTDIFEPTVSESIAKSIVPITGTKTFEFNFSVNTEGQYVIPDIEFSYFDPATATYKTISTKQFLFTVTTAVTPVLPETDHYVRKETASGINKIFTNRWWIIAIIAIIAMTGIILWIQQDHSRSANTGGAVKNEPRKELDTNGETISVALHNPLLRTEQCLNKDDCSSFYNLLNSELKNFLAYKLSLDPGLMNTRNIIIALDKKNVDNDIVLRLQQLLEEIEWQLYTPFERNERMKDLYQQATTIVQFINSQQITHQ